MAKIQDKDMKIEVKVRRWPHHRGIRYHKNCRILYEVVASSCGQDGLDEATAVWGDWATKKANWVDPTVDRDDKLFGEQ